MLASPDNSRFCSRYATEAASLVLLGSESPTGDSCYTHLTAGILFMSRPTRAANSLQPCLT